MDQAVPTLSPKQGAAVRPWAPVAFHLIGRRSPDQTEAMDQLGLLPALFAGFRDLTRLRYDFPLVLVRDGGDEAPIQSLSGLFDKVLKDFSGAPDGERLRQPALRIERQIRAHTAARKAGGTLSGLWSLAAPQSAPADEQLGKGLRRLRAALPGDGDVVDCDETAAPRVCHHLWTRIHEQKARRFGDTARKLVSKLSDILRADFDRSAEGLSAGRLEASVGTIHRDAFDFELMSRQLAGASARTPLPQSRRRRIEWALSVLAGQRFFPSATDGGDATAPYEFVFEHLADALAAHRDRLPLLVDVAKAMAIAELEVGGLYKESTHDDFFAQFGAENLDPRDLDFFPDYLICLRAWELQPADGDAVLEAASAGMRAKVLIQFDDILTPSSLGGHPVLDWRSRQLSSAAMGMGSVYVLHAAASSLFRVREPLGRGMGYAGSALFLVYSGAGGTCGGLPPYLVAAAATESRAFPSFAYDPSAGADWASRFQLLDNPQVEVDWPVQTLTYEDETHRGVSESVAFTLADFVACDRRHGIHFAPVPRAAWGEGLVAVPAFLADGAEGTAPCLTMVDRDGRLHKIVVDDKLIREARRCAGMWRSLQELGGVHNSHAARVLAEQRKAQAAQADAPAAETRVSAEPAPAEKPPAAAEPATAEKTSDDPYIETPRCTTCNECTQINGKMFAYDANKQAYIANLDAGTYRQLVEAAESCQVAIIHPGKPRNANEPGLDELLVRAEPFL
jgi:hypothetical protein